MGESSNQGRQISEQIWAGILLRYLRSKGCDYQIAEFTTPGWSADVDVFALSRSKSCEPLYLQLCRDIVFLEEFDLNPGSAKFFKTDSSAQDSDTSAIVKKKTDKYTASGKIFSHITLVIQKTLILPGVLLSYEQDFDQKCRDAGFKAVYAVSAGGTHGTGRQAEIVLETAIQIC